MTGELGVTDDLGVPAVWLRANCPCPACCDGRSGQRLVRLLDLPRELAVEKVERAGDHVTVTFAPDGHRATFAARWLEESAEGGGRTEDTKRLWASADLGQVPTATWERYRSDDAERLRLLRAVQELGVGLLTGTPSEPSTVLEVAATFGYVRETNYGRLFDVRVEAEPSNLALTGRAIPPHTDNPYRDPVPTCQLLHCLTNAVEGGGSGVVDGFLAASLLREEDPAAFALLASTSVPFAWTDGHHHLAAEGPVVQTDGRGRIRGVRWNDRSMGPVRLPPAELGPVYDALMRFAAVVARPELLIELRLGPGDCLVMDNTRVLHARTAFADTASGYRHLQGCYADLDGLDSTVIRLQGRAAGAGWPR